MVDVIVTFVLLEGEYKRGYVTRGPWYLKSSDVDACVLGQRGQSGALGYVLGCYCRVWRVWDGVER